MASLDEIVGKQKIGSKFVLSAPMLGMDLIAFDAQAEIWQTQGGPGFQACGIPFRKVINGQFLIQRITVIRTESA